ncbi:primosomal protein N' [Sodalis-like secondary symbiont of Drepanosiphum platanoidis]|uniref:replication restart helicase PriA n=1 Tax=Sodalis-like secondary symbiont of Drepanosiphum platanoidis TaxID=2994493 RepID=UPI003463FC3E
MLIVKVALPIPLINTFDYVIIEYDNILSGIRVKVPFKNKEYIGIIVDIYTNKNNFFKKKLKKVIKILDKKPLFSKDIWSMLLWSVNYYHYPIGKILFYSLPILLRKENFFKKEKPLEWYFLNKKSNIDLTKLKNAPKQKKALLRLIKGPLKKNQINKLGFSKKIFQELENKKLCYIKFLSLKNDIYISIFKKKYNNLFLKKNNNFDLKDFFKKINKFSVWLLSQNIFYIKIKMYLIILKKIFLKKKQVLFLVPKISLILQIFNILNKYFSISIAIFHSKINKKKQLSIWLKVKNGKYCVVIGTKSALFIPFKKLGIIIVNEEHDFLYKQQNGWLYNARDLSILRARIKNIPIILDSITPSLETLYNIKKKKYNKFYFFNLKDKSYFYKKKLINIKKKILINGISNELLKKIKKHIFFGNQVLILLERKKFSKILFCCKCNYILKCLLCNNNYNLHKYNKKLYCYNCNFQEKIFKTCPQCLSKKFIKVEIGTKQIEKFLKIKIPKIPIIRIDKDKFFCQKKIKENLKKIKENKYRILIGTNSLVKEYYFPYVTLVGILDIDNMLFSNDFRSSEKFSQIYTQISLKSSQIKKKEILLQTNYPNHPLLIKLLKLKYKEFSYIILKERFLTMLPPFIYHILFYSEDSYNIFSKSFLKKIKNLLNKNIFIKKNFFRVIGPIPAFSFKINGKFRWNLLISGHNRIHLNYLIKKNLKFILKLPEIKKVKWIIDVDPISIK